MPSITAAVIREASGPFLLEELRLDHPSEREVLVRIVGVGICHTDLLARDQVVPFPIPAVLGHEGAGRVEAVGSAVRKVKPGDAVVLSFAHCGICENCRGHQPAYCSRAAVLNFGSVRPGAGAGALEDANHRAVHGNFFGQSSFASHVLCDEHGVVKVPSDVPLEMMGPLGCGVQTGAGIILNVLKPGPRASVAIFGAGAVGLSALMAARLAGGTTLIAIDRIESRLRLATELGATHIIDARSGDVLDRIRAFTGSGVNYSVECTGSPTVLRRAIEALRPGGTCALVGAAGRRAEVCLNMSFMLNGRTLRGSVEGDSMPEEFIPQLIELWRGGKFPFHRLVTFYDFTRINEAVADTASGLVIKPILRLPSRHDAIPPEI